MGISRLDEIEQSVPLNLLCPLCHKLYRPGFPYFSCLEDETSNINLLLSLYKSVEICIFVYRWILAKSSLLRNLIIYFSEKCSSYLRFKVIGEFVIINKYRQNSELICVQKRRIYLIM